MRTQSLILALTVFLSGCASAGDHPHFRYFGGQGQPQPIHTGGLGGVLYEGADKLIDDAVTRFDISTAKPIIVATSVNVDDLADSSTFGRLASQLVASRLSQRKYLVRDVTYTQALTVTPETGEMTLSREAAKLARDEDAQAVIAGAYAVGGEKIYLNLRMLAAADGRLISSVDLVIPLNEDTQRMIVTGRNDLQRRAALGR
jgi:hypothetical protein